MGAAQARNRRLRLTEVRFITPPEPVKTKDGIALADYGMFVDGDGKPVEVVIDMKDPFRHRTSGLAFSQEDGHRALKGWLGRQLTHDERQRLWWDVRRSGLPRYAKTELRRMRAEFGRKTA